MIRKATSVALAIIMVAGGVTLAIPGALPATEAANANLFVSAENPQFDNHMSGPQVIEVVIIDSSIGETDESKGEPDVTINGKILKMAQAVDGNWYGYFADLSQAQIADSTQTDNPGYGLDFGAFCTDPDGDFMGFSTSDSSGIAIPYMNTGSEGSPDGGQITVACEDVDITNSNVMPGTNVIREAKDLNTNRAVDMGQIGFTSESHWPFVQLYMPSVGGNVVIQYNKGGGAQTTTLAFDTVDDYAGLQLDRTIYPQGAEVHATITDSWLNIDPTDEDSWTWATNEDMAATYYQVFDENGVAVGDDPMTGSVDISDVADAIMLEGNGVLYVDSDTQNTGSDIIAIQDNGDTVLADNIDINDIATAASKGGLLAAGSQPVTVTEGAPNTGIFGSYDESDQSALRITDDAKRGTSATIDYNDTPMTILVGFDFAEIDIAPDTAEWSSGQAIPITISDGDANKNSRSDEAMALDDPATALIPTLVTGDPFTLGEGDSPMVYLIKPPTENTAIITAHQAAALYDDIGMTAAFTAITAGADTRMPGEIYPFVLDRVTYEIVAHGGDTNNVGKNATEVLGTSNKSVAEIEGELDVNQYSWVEYVFFNPDTGENESKKSYLYQHPGGDYVFGAGYYMGGN